MEPPERKHVSVPGGFHTENIENRHYSFGIYFFQFTENNQYKGNYETGNTDC